MQKAHQWTDRADKVLILRRCNADMTSRGGFVWPERGVVKFSDFNPIAICGGGGHGWPWGIGLGEGKDYDIIGDKWLVVAALPGDVVGEIDGGNKCKISRGEVIYCGAFAAAWELVNSGRHRLIAQMAYVDAAEISRLAKDELASGNDSQLAASGNYSIAAIAANGGRVKVGKNGAFALAFFTADIGWRFVVGKVGENGIKADTWYRVSSGEIIECND